MQKLTNKWSFNYIINDTNKKTENCFMKAYTYVNGTCFFYLFRQTSYSQITGTIVHQQNHGTDLYYIKGIFLAKVVHSWSQRIGIIGKAGRVSNFQKKRSVLFTYGSTTIAKRNCYNGDRGTGFQSLVDEYGLQPSPQITSLHRRHQIIVMPRTFYLLDSGVLKEK